MLRNKRTVDYLIFARE